MSENKGIIEFLIELSEQDSAMVLHKAHATSSDFILNLDNAKIHKIKLLNFLDKRVILDANADILILPENTDLSFKFNVDNEVYFIKTKIKKYLNKYYFDSGTKVIQLKRRKEPRYSIPTSWKQQACILNKKLQINCRVKDISLSGIRLEVLQTSIAYNRDEIITIKFQIYKRSEIQTTAVVRFSLIKPSTNQILGLEFTSGLSDVYKEKVSSIIEDIQMHNANQTK